MSNPHAIPVDATADRRSHGRRKEDIRNEQLSRVISQIPDGVVCIDRDWRITFANDEGRRISQIGPQHIESDSIWEMFPAILNTGLERVYRAVMETGVSEHLEHYSTRSDLWLDVHTIPLREGIAVLYRDITDRKGAEFLRDSASRRLMQVLEATTDAVVSIDRNDNFTYLNRRARELLAVKGDLLGKNLWQEFPFAKNNGQYLHYFNLAMHEGVPGEFEDFYPDPLNLWLAFQIRPSDEGVVIFFRDITARRSSNVALQQQRDLLSVVQQTARVATWDVDVATGTITFGEGSYPVFGRPLSELPDLHAFTRHVLPEYVPVVAELIRKTSATGEMIVTDFPIRASDGTLIWVECRGKALIVDGVAVRLRGLSIDITSRKTSEEATERQHAELETVYRTAPIGLALFDPVEFRYLRVNDRQVETIGAPREKILGKRIVDIAPLPGIEDLFRQVAAGDSIRNHIFEGELPTRPGEHRYWNCNYSPVYNSDREVVAIAAAVQEITHQKKSEQALVQSEKLAAVGRLASSISHEINNPLEAITNLLYLIGKADDLPPELMEYVNTAQGELSRVCEIATQTLRFHRQAVKATFVTARDLVEAVLHLYQGRLANSGITVETGFTTSTAVLCHENDIRQVLNNLIANAIDAMRLGGRLLIRAHDATDLLDPVRRKGIRITVADTGHGMSPAVRSRIFEPFYTTKELNGTGLGLWISLGIVERHRGRLTLRSTQHPIHHGTIFSLFLPCHDGIQEEALPQED
ncbi:MAG: PAS domain-containing protein [Acidobacteria bacterium]|nr:PAS domain-containing protein [Acidobacteriota bacterium]